MKLKTTNWRCDTSENNNYNNQKTKKKQRKTAKTTKTRTQDTQRKKKQETETKTTGVCDNQKNTTEHGKWTTNAKYCKPEPGLDEWADDATRNHQRTHEGQNTHRYDPGNANNQKRGL